MVHILASDSLQGRFIGTDNAHKAAVFIAQEFKKAGTSPLQGDEDYLKPFVAYHGSAKIGLNVVACLPGKAKADELIIFCAHYDHIGTASTNPFKNPGLHNYRAGDTIFNGANDNASGVAAVIALAYYFGHLKNNDRTILFIAFSGEELGLVGSESLATVFDAKKVQAVINIEMIGRSISRKKKKAYITGPYYSDMQRLLNKKLLETSPKIYGSNFFMRDPFSEEGLFYRSDNYSFAKQGIPSHTIIATDPKDIYYHSPADEISTLDFKLMSHLVQAITLGCSGIIAGTDTPTRIHPHNLRTGNLAD